MRSLPLLLLLLLILVVTTAWCQTQNAAIQSQEGIISVTSSSSCAIGGTTNNCGAEGTETTIEFAVQPETTLTFEFFVLSDRGTTLPGTARNCIAQDETGRCLVGRPLSVSVEASPVVMGYDLNGRAGLDIPFAYIALHSQTYKRISEREASGSCAGYSDFYIANQSGNDDTRFYMTPRVDSIMQYAAAGAATPDAAAQNWGDTQSVFNLEVDPDVNNICTDHQYQPNAPWGLKGNGRGRSFFDAPFIAASNHERDGLNNGGSYRCRDASSCCGSSVALLTGAEAQCNDDSYCMDRTYWCSMCTPFIGNYFGQSPWVVDYNPVGNVNVLSGQDTGKVTNWDDNNDNDSCQDDDNFNDDEHDDSATNLDQDKPSGICRINDPDDDNNGIPDCGLSTDEINAILEEYCDCSDGTEDNNGYTCIPKVRGPAAGLFANQYEKNTCSELDYNLSDRMGGDPDDPNGSRFFFCPFWEGRDDDEDDECGGTLGNAGKSCGGADSPRRAYCGSACSDKFMQDLQGANEDTSTSKTNPACRFLAGSAFVVQPVYKCIDDGDGGNNTGFDRDCFDQCMMNPETCNLFEAGCFLERPPLYDDCDGDDARKLIVNGPERTFYINPVPIGLSGTEFGLHANAGNRWFSNVPANIRPEPNDVSFGSVDDVDYCSVQGLGDQKGPVNQDTGESSMGTFVAHCPMCACMPSGDFQPDGAKYFKDVNDPTYVPESFICAPELFDGTPAGYDGIDPVVSTRCNTPYPGYEDDGVDLVTGDRIRDDDMHPTEGGVENLFYFKQGPTTLCPEGPPDRRGLYSLDQSATTDGALNRQGQTRVRGHDTAETVALLAPFCHAYDIQKRPVPYSMLNITITDTSTTGAAPPETIILMAYDTTLSDGTTINSQGSNAASTIFAQFDAIRSTTGSIGTDLDGMISICNATDTGGAGTPPTYNMGGATSDPMSFFTNAWEAIREGTSIFHEGVAKRILPGGKVENSDLTGMVPLPQLLYNVPDAYDTTTTQGDTTSTQLPLDYGSVKKGSFWYYVPPRLMNTYGHGCKQIGMTAQFFGNDANAATACAGNRYRCAPGYIEGFDWTYPQRRYDSDIVEADNRLNTQRTPETLSGNGGAYERILRDYRLTEFTPGVISGQFMELLSTTSSCSQFVAELNRFGHLPPNWVEDAGEDQCGLPLYFIQNNKLIYFDPQVRASTIFNQGRLVVADGYLLAAGQALSPGRIVSVDVCIVGEASTNGHLAASVENVGTISSAYQLFANCTGNNVLSTGSDTETLAGGQTLQFNIPLSQFGAVDQGDQTFVCDLFLTSPSLPGVRLDSATADNCVISAASDPTFNLPNNGTVDECTLYGVNCQADGSGGNFGTGYESESNLLMVILLLVGSILLVGVFWFCAYNSGSQKEQYYRLKLGVQAAG